MGIDSDDVEVAAVERVSETVVDTDSEDEDDSILVDTCFMESQSTLYAGKTAKTNNIMNKSNGKRGTSKSKSTANNHGQKLRNGERGPSKSKSTTNNYAQKLRRPHNKKGM
jgi:hypothetical protein